MLLAIPVREALIGAPRQPGKQCTTMYHFELAGSDRRPPDSSAPAAVGYALPISKLRGVPFQARVALKVRRITTCNQLLAAAARKAERDALAQQAKLDPAELTRLVQRADMARVNGVGAVFGQMLEDLGIRDVPTLAAQEPETLHAQLRRYNQQEKLARRSPTPEEVTSWIAQARRLSSLVTY